MQSANYQTTRKSKIVVTPKLLEVGCKIFSIFTQCRASIYLVQGCSLNVPRSLEHQVTMAILNANNTLTRKLIYLKYVNIFQSINLLGLELPISVPRALWHQANRVRYITRTNLYRKLNCQQCLHILEGINKFRLGPPTQFSVLNSFQC